jgi:5'-3' exonuclease
MYTVARAEHERGGRALLLTGDRDLYAAVSERVAFLELPKKGAAIELGPAEVRERYGVAPDQVADFIALRGDPSDGIPGAPGIGAKTAAELLREHGSLEALLTAANSPLPPLRPRLVGVLRDNETLLRDFKHIATMQLIDMDAPAERETDFAAGAAAARAFGMRRLAERLEKLATA